MALKKDKVKVNKLNCEFTPKVPKRKGKGKLPKPLSLDDFMAIIAPH